MIFFFIVFLTGNFSGWGGWSITWQRFTPWYENFRQIIRTCCENKSCGQGRQPSSSSGKTVYDIIVNDTHLSQSLGTVNIYFEQAIMFQSYLGLFLFYQWEVECHLFLDPAPPFIKKNSKTYHHLKKLSALNPPPPWKKFKPSQIIFYWNSLYIACTLKWNWFGYIDMKNLCLTINIMKCRKN